MRRLLWCLSLVLISAVLGCGSGQRPASGVLTGRWLAMNPATQSSESWCWPTRLFTFNADQTFAYEEGAPENQVTGTYTVAGAQVQLRNLQRQGTVTGLQHDTLSVVVNGDTLAVVDADQSYQCARLAAQPPSFPTLDWLLARQLTAQQTDVPLPASVRLIIGDAGSVQQVCAQPSSEGCMTLTGQLLQTTTGAIAVRLIAGQHAPGALALLGRCSMRDGRMTMQLPDGGQCCYVSGVAPDLRLATDWNNIVNGVSTTLSLHSDGSYLRVVDGVTTTGQWRVYCDNYLCLTGDTEQHTYTWDLWRQGGSLVLRLGEWAPLGDGTCHFMQTTWTHPNG